jgi:hypothetical protein
MTCPVIDNAASCEIHGQNVMCLKELKDNGVECSWVGGRTNVHDEEQSGRLSAMSDDFVHS